MGDDDGVSRLQFMQVLPNGGCRSLLTQSSCLAPKRRHYTLAPSSSADGFRSRLASSPVLGLKPTPFFPLPGFASFDRM